MRVTFVRSEAVAPHVKSFYFKPASPVRYEAGQFAEFYLPHENADSRGERREFSLSSSPDEPLLAITTDFYPDGSSFKRTLLKLKRGDIVTITEPMGDFVLPKAVTIPLVFVAAGIGCTPYVSMVKWLTAHNEQRPIQLIYSASTPDEIMFGELWRDYPLTFTPIISRPADEWRGATGRLTTSKLLELASPIAGKLIYLAGPQSFIEPFFNDLLAAGLPRSQLLLDYFPGY